MERLIVNDLSAYSGSDTLLSKINVDLSLGSSLVIVGRSGSGKTLLTKLLIGQCPSNVQMTGRITCQDMRLDQLDAKQWQSIRGRHMAYMEIGRAHSELQSPQYLVCRLLLEKKKQQQ